MNSMKVDMVKFLMTMFDSYKVSSSGVSLFKANVDELVRRNQIPNDVKNLVYSMYGILNTDTYKASANAMKLMQINWMMLEIETVYSNSKELSKCIDRINAGVVNKTILKSAKDIVFEIYDLGASSISAIAVDDEDAVDAFIEKAKQLESKRASVSSSRTTVSSAVKADISKIKPEKLSEVYYEYANPNFSGCSTSSRYCHEKLGNCLSKPRGATLVYRCESGDPCSPTVSYKPIPNSWYKPVKKEEEPTVKVNSPVVSADPCRGGILNRIC